MDTQNNKTIEKDGLILNEDGKIVIGVKDYSITNVVIPEGVEEVGENAFSYCYQIEMVTFPSTLRKIGFASLKGIRVCCLSIPEGVEVIEEAAFFGSSFTYVSLPSTLKVLEDAFLNCTIKNLFIKVRDLDSLKIYGHQKYLSEERNPFSMRYPDYTNLYVPSDLVDTYKKHPIFGRFEHIEDITQPENDDIKWEHTRYFVQDFYGMKIIWWIPFIKEDGNWCINDPMRTYLLDELKVIRGLDALCEAFSYDGIHAEMIIAISDNQNLIDEESGCLAKCRKASASSGAEYYVNLECMNKHEGLFWITPKILFAITHFPKYMKIMPQKLDDTQLESLGIMHE